MENKDFKEYLNDNDLGYGLLRENIVKKKYYQAYKQTFSDIEKLEKKITALKVLQEVLEEYYPND